VLRTAGTTHAHQLRKEQRHADHRLGQVTPTTAGPRTAGTTHAHQERSSAMQTTGWGK
jgi:hypothetical protein